MDNELIALSLISYDLSLSIPRRLLKYWLDPGIIISQLYSVNSFFWHKFIEHYIFAFFKIFKNFLNNITGVYSIVLISIFILILFEYGVNGGIIPSIIATFKAIMVKIYELG